MLFKKVALVGRDKLLHMACDAPASAPAQCSSCVFHSTLNKSCSEEVIPSSILVLNIFHFILMLLI